MDFNISSQQWVECIMEYDAVCGNLEVCKGKVITPNPGWCAYIYFFRVTCDDPCPFRISKQRLDWEMPLHTNLVKNEINSLNKKLSFVVFFALHDLCLDSLM